MPERYKRRRAVIHDEGFIAAEDALKEGVETAPVDLIPVHELKMLSAQRGILRERLVHRVGVYADRANAVRFVILREKTRDQTFAHSSFTLQGEVHRGGAVGDLWIVIH